MSSGQKVFCFYRDIYAAMSFEITFDLILWLLQAFTGSIIEHDDNISTLQPSKSAALQNVRCFFKVLFCGVQIHIDLLCS